MATHRSWKRRVRRISIVVVLIGTGLAGMAGFIWWQEAPLRQAERELQAGRADDALLLVDDWRSDHGSTDAALALRARCLVELGYDAEALRVFAAVGAETPEELHAWARAQLRSERWAQALPLLEAVLERRPNDADVLHELSACCARLGMLDRAVGYAEQFAEHDAFRHRGLLMIGMLRKQQGNKPAAAEAWAQIADDESAVADLQVPAHEFLTEYAALQLDLGKPEQALRLLQRANAIQELPESRHLQGQAEQQLGRLDAARDQWQRALVLNPDHRGARESLARAALADNQPDLAHNFLRPLLDGSRPLTSSTTYLMQRVATLRGDDEQIARWTEKTESLRKSERLDSAVQQMLRENPNSYWAIVVRAYQFAEAGNWDQANVMLSTLPVDERPQEFVVQLRQAIDRRDALPSVDLLPIELF